MTEPGATGDVIVVGLGNPILGDDGVGWRVADGVEAWLATRPPAERTGVTVERLAVGGLTLMERLVGHRDAILVDAMLTGDVAPGTVRTLDVSQVPGRAAGHLDAAHDASLADALAAGRALGAALPERITIVAIEAAQVAAFSEEMTPAVAAAVAPAIAAVLAAIRA